MDDESSKYNNSNESKKEESNNDDVNIKIQESSLTRIESQFLVTTLEDSVRQLLILGACSTDSKVKNFQENEINLPEDRLERLNYAELASDNHKIAKMNSDRNYVTCVIIKMYLDLQKNNSFASLSMALSDIATRTYQSMAQVLQHNENRSMLKSLQSQYNTEVQLNKSVLENSDVQIHKLRDEIADKDWNCKITKQCVTEWQNAKIDQHKLRNSQAEQSLTNELNETKTKIEQEILVNQEIEKFMRMRMQELSDDVELWNNKYDAESIDFDAKICEMNELRRLQLEKTDALQKLLEDHKREMDNWISFVEDRKQRLELERLLQKSAIKIQAWWRGLLVRRRLAAKLAKNSKRKSAKKKKK